MVFGAPHDISRRRAASAGAGREQDGAGDAGQQQQEEHVSVAPPLRPAGTFTSSAPSNSTVSAARFPQHAHDWDHAVPIIRELYMVQNLPLPRVIEIMTTKHGFKATYGQFCLFIVGWILANTPLPSAQGCTRAASRNGAGPRMRRGNQQSVRDRGRPGDQRSRGEQIKSRADPGSRRRRPRRPTG